MPHITGPFVGQMLICFKSIVMVIKHVEMKVLIYPMSNFMVSGSAFQGFPGGEMGVNQGDLEWP